MRTGRIRGRTKRRFSLNAERTGAACLGRSLRREVADDIGRETVHTGRTAATTADLQRRQAGGTSLGAADQPLAIARQCLQRQRNFCEDLAILDIRVGLNRVIEEQGERRDLPILIGSRNCIEKAIRSGGAQWYGDGRALAGCKGERGKTRQVRYRNGGCSGWIDCVDGVCLAADRVAL